MKGAQRRQRHVRLTSETVELLRDEPELLAIADAIQATQHTGLFEPSRHSVTRRAILAAALLGALALAIGIGLEVSGSGSDLIDRAEAAAGSGRVTTVVASRAFPGESLVDLNSGTERPVIVRVECWRDTVTGQTRFRVLHDRQVLYDAVSRRLPDELLSTDNALNVVRDFVAGYRPSLRNGTAVETTGSNALGGRPVVWLRVPSTGDADHRSGLDVALDTRTLTPVRLGNPRSTAGWTVTSFETSNSLAALRTASPRQVPRGAPSALVSTTDGKIGSARRWLGAGFRLPGAKPGAGRLRSVKLQSIRVGEPGAARFVHGVSLSFGAVGSSLDMNLATQATQTHGFADNHLTISFSPIPPDGQVALARLGSRWTAQGHQAGIFFSIEGPSRSSVLSAARSLRSSVQRS